jgi:hypothetical protein
MSTHMRVAPSGATLFGAGSFLSHFRVAGARSTMCTLPEKIHGLLRMAPHGIHAIAGNPIGCTHA